MTNSPTFHDVHFSGLRSRVSELTWGQRWIWDEVQWFAPHHEHLNVPLIVDVPDGTTLPRVLAAVRTLVESRESLRTTYPLSGTGEPRQSVAARGGIRVEVRSAAGESRAVAEAFAAELRRVPFAVDELPFRVGVVADEGGPRHVVAVVFHMSADGWDIAHITAETERLLAAPATSSIPSAGDRLHPSDQAERERGAEGARTSERSIRYWEAQLARAPAVMLPAGAGVAGTPRFQEVVCESEAMAVAVQVLAQRLRVSETAIFLAVAALLLGRRADGPVCCFTVCCHNRIGPDEVAATGTFVQDVPVTIDVGDVTFAEAVRRTWRALLPAYAAGKYDPVRAAAVVEEAVRRRGSDVDLSCTLNVMLGANGDGPDLVGSAGAATRDVVEALRSRTRMSGKPGRDRDRFGRRFYLRAHNFSGAVLMSLRVDTLAMPVADAVSFLQSMEQTAVEALADTERTQGAGGPV
ncbi:condensation domain-containing protein [Streptomyces sp. NPDC001388]|uniref:condensation domain-containing protein n=1 Tax=Streptomyces sp. NPDC001388 TaxID=3364568 RepID=UPI00367943B5